MDDIKRDIEKLEREVEAAKTDQARDQGKLEVEEVRLQELGVDSLEAGDKEVKNLTSEISKLDTEIETEFNTLREEYEWE